MCINSSVTDDDEIKLILSEATLEMAVESFNKGDLRAACKLFDDCIEACSSTIYETGVVIAKASSYFKYMGKYPRLCIPRGETRTRCLHSPHFAMISAPMR